MDPELRDARDGDADGLIALIGACFAEYPGCVLDVDGELPELRSIATAFARLGGRFWVAERAGGVVASVGVVPTSAAGVWELRKLYVARSERRRGLATRLTDRAEEWARSQGAREIELWTDTRFADAHRFYERRGYRREPEARALHDKSHSVEFHYRLVFR